MHTCLACHISFFTSITSATTTSTVVEFGYPRAIFGLAFVRLVRRFVWGSFFSFRHGWGKPSVIRLKLLCLALPNMKPAS
ncbi:hypothetical protein F5Y09DRAFT_326599 [Xylaria sp. FL1042]|nr:hypothetical protein F5Y09DRAFT_326599 [Xylaria sp. FL1042]